LFCVNGDPAVPGPLGGVPKGFIPRGIAEFGRKLSDLNLDLLEAEDVRRLFFHPVEKTFLQNGAQAVDIPA